MEGVEVRVNGLAEVIKELQNCTDRARRAIRKEIKAGGQVMAEAARSRVPKLTGNVANNIYVQNVKTTQNYMRAKVTLKRQGAEGFPLEVGHVQSGWFAGFPGTVAPRPFMRNAFGAKEREVTQNMEAGIIRAATKK